MMRNYKADLFALIFIALVAIASFMSNSCKKEDVSVKPAHPEAKRLNILYGDSLNSMKYRIESDKWRKLYMASQRDLIVSNGIDKQKAEKAKHSADTYVKTPSLATCNEALSDCQSENETKAYSLAIQDRMLILADSLHRLDRTELARLDSVKFALSSGWKKANDELKKVSKIKPFGLGVMAGFGASKSGLGPFLGVGISYNLIRF